MNFTVLVFTVLAHCGAATGLSQLWWHHQDVPRRRWWLVRRLSRSILVLATLLAKTYWQQFCWFPHTTWKMLGVHHFACVEKDPGYPGTRLAKNNHVDILKYAHMHGGMHGLVLAWACDDFCLTLTLFPGNVSFSTHTKWWTCPHPYQSFS